MRFFEAIAYALSREVVLPETYYQQFNEASRKRAISIAGLARLEQVRNVVDQLNDVLKDGGTFRDFQNKVAAGEIGVDLPAHRLDNIFRTNAQVAYNHGRWVQMQRVKSIRPYLMYDAVNDSRTRPSHAALDGLIRHIDDAVWGVIFPPNGFRCRCVCRSLTPKQMTERGGLTKDVSFAKADPGWAGGPGQINDDLLKIIDAHQPMLSASNQTLLGRIKDQIKGAVNDPFLSDAQVVERWVDAVDLESYQDLYNQINNNFYRSIVRHDLTFEEAVALRYYTGASAGFSQVNGFLHGRGTQIDQPDLMVDAVLLLNRAAKKMPVFQGQVIRRTTLPDSELERFEVGALVTLPAFNSSTYGDKDVVIAGQKKHRLVIESKTGRRIDEISASPDELEVLFAQGTRFEVVDVLEYPDYIEIELTEFVDDATP